jgi:hypothetical protein
MKAKRKNLKRWHSNRLRRLLVIKHPSVLQLRRINELTAALLKA